MSNEQNQNEQKQDSSQESKPIEQMFDRFLTPMDKAVDVKLEEFKKQVEEKEKEMEDRAKLKEICYPVRYQYVCEGDKVLVKVGRYWYYGIVLRVGKLGLLLNNDNRKVTIALGKISTLTIVEEGDNHKKFIKVFGSDIDKGME